jgi:hypothetical protein
LNLTFVLHLLGGSSRPILSIASTFPSAITVQSSVSISGNLVISLFDESIGIVGVVDGNLASGRSIWESRISSGANFGIEILRSILRPGSHSFTVYTVDSTGSVSFGSSFSALVAGLTATRLRRVRSGRRQSPGSPFQRWRGASHEVRFRRPFPSFQLDIYRASNG